MAESVFSANVWSRRDRKRVYSDAELQVLVAPIALYPDDLVAAILTAANRPADVEQAARYAPAATSEARLHFRTLTASRVRT